MTIGARQRRDIEDFLTDYAYCIDDGRVVEIWEFVWDLFHVDEFWS